MYTEATLIRLEDALKGIKKTPTKKETNEIRLAINEACENINPNDWK